MNWKYMFDLYIWNLDENMTLSIWQDMYESNDLWKVDENMILSILQQWIDLYISMLRDMYERNDSWKIDENMILFILQDMYESNDSVVSWSMILVIINIDL